MSAVIPKAALEAAARALCSHAGHPENGTADGWPMWVSYVPEARAALEAALPHLNTPYQPRKATR